MAEFIERTDTLNEGREKLNTAISDAEEAKGIAGQADDKATQALANSEDTQTQLDTIVIEGDSSVEAAQARVDEKGEVHPTLKARIDDGLNSVNQDLAQARVDEKGEVHPTLKARIDSGINKINQELLSKADQESLNTTNENVTYNDIQISGLGNQIDELFESGYDEVSKTQDSFEGSESTRRFFSQYMDGFSISNLGSSTLSFTINGVTIKVPAGMGYNGFFEEFLKVDIQASGFYTALARGKGDLVPIIDTFSMPEFGVTDTGRTYTYGGSVSSPNWAIDNGKAYVTNAVNSSETYAVIESAANNISLKSDITLAGFGTTFGGLALKHVDNSNWILIRGDHSSGVDSLKILLKSNGSWSTLTTLPFALVAGDTYTVEVTYVDRLIVVHVDGVRIGHYTLKDIEHLPVQSGRNWGIVVKHQDTRHDNLVIKTV